MSFLPPGKCCSYGRERTIIENLLHTKETAHPFPHSHTHRVLEAQQWNHSWGHTLSPNPPILFPNQKQDSEKTGSCPPKPLTTQLHIGLFAHAHPLTTPHAHTQYTLTQFACLERALVWNPSLDSGIPGFKASLGLSFSLYKSVDWPR